MKRRLTILAAIVALTLLVVAGFTLRRPTMPSSWHQLRPGMPRAEVLFIVGTDTFDGRSEKGFEEAHVETQMAGMSAYWQVFLRYDSSERLKTARVRFVNRDHGILSTDEVPLF